jgi:predicted HAD superfamily Cof-like phosphohydrolase
MSTRPLHSALARALDEWNRIFGYHVSDTPTADLPETVKDLRVRLLEEECRELVDAIREGDLAHIAKEAADLAYVLRGTTEAYGLDLETAVEEVHASNMTKLGADGKPVYAPSGKAIKGPGYMEPTMARTLGLPGPALVPPTAVAQPLAA